MPLRYAGVRPRVASLDPENSSREHAWPETAAHYTQRPTVPQGSLSVSARL